MLSIESVIAGFIFLMGVGLIFGLLFWLLSYLESKITPSPPLVWVVLRIFLAVSLVFVLIGFILQLMGHPILRW